MLEQALVALAASGGSAVVTAAGTDAWDSARGRLARWLGRGDAEREGAELERLERTAVALRQAAPGEIERVSMRQEGTWQTRIEDLFEGLPDAERTRAADELRSLLAPHTTGAVTAGAGGAAVGGNADLRADRGSVVAVRMGDVTLGTAPEQPDPRQPGPDYQG